MALKKPLYSGEYLQLNQIPKRIHNSYVPDQEIDWAKISSDKMTIAIKFVDKQSDEMEVHIWHYQGIEWVRGSGY